MAISDTLRGFRRQFLYSAGRLLKPKENERIFIPEGKEDLDILDAEGNTIELIQVKDLKDPIQLSTLWSTERTSFFRRAIGEYRKGNCPKLTLATFGEVGPELVAFTERTDEKVVEKLKRMGFAADEMEFIRENLTFETASQSGLETICYQAIDDLMLGLEPRNALDLLQFWIWAVAEKQQRVSYQDVVGKVSDIGKFIKNRDSFIRHYHSTIRGFENVELTNERKEKLRKDYRIGRAAQYEHILAGLDVVRNKPIERIEREFQNFSIVLVHGASGQGKSTLALRYVQEYCPGISFRLLLAETQLEIQEQVQALQELSRSIGFPFLVYLDVEPGNTKWVDVLNDLEGQENLRLLVTIRTEDLNRSTTKDKYFEFAEIELNFEIDEARDLYGSLEESSPDPYHSDFDEAWQQFGGSGPLLEFTFLITQGKHLKTRINSQVAKVAETGDDTLNLLAVIALADSMNSPVRITELEKAGITNTLKNSLRLFEKEYLIYIDNKNGIVSGMHPLRSEIILQVLNEDFHNRIEKIFQVTCKLIPEGNIYFFLLGVFFRYRKIRDEIRANPASLIFSSWEGRLNCAKALIWLDIFTLVRDNEDLIDEIRVIDESFLFFMVHFDVTNSLDPKEFPSGFIRRKMMEGIGKRIDVARIQKEDFFVTLKTWFSLSEHTVGKELVAHELRYLGELMFWAGFLGERVGGFPDLSGLEEICNSVNAETIAHLLVGLHTYGYDPCILKDIQEVFLEKLQREYDIPLVKCADDKIGVSFLLDVYEMESDEEQSSFRKKTRILRLLRLAFPEKEQYDSQGYGHKFLTQIITYDDSSAAIKKESLPLPMLTQINSIFRGLCQWEFRPDSWEDYAAVEMRIRQRFLHFGEDFLTKMIKYLKKNRESKYLRSLASEGKNSFSNISSYHNLFPKSVSDPFALVYESNSSEGKREIINLTSEGGVYHPPAPITTHKYEPYTKFRRKYFTHFRNFLRQWIERIEETEGAIHACDKQQIHVVRSNIHTALLHLTAYQASFDELFSKYVEEDSSYKTLAESELRLLYRLLATVQAILSNDQTPSWKVADRALKSFERERIYFEKQLRKNLDQLVKSSTEIMGHKLDFFRDSKEIVIAFDFLDAVTIYENIKLVYDAIFKAYGNAHPYGVKMAALEMSYEQILIIPVLNLEAINDKAYRFHWFSFRGGNSESIPHHRWIPIEIDRKYLKKLGLELWQDSVPEIQKPTAWQKAFAELYLTVHRVAELKQIADVVEDDSIGLEVLNEFFINAAMIGQRTWTDALNLLMDLLKSFDLPVDQIEKQTYSEQQLFHFASKVWENIFPLGLGNGVEEVKLKLDDLIVWLESLNKIQLDQLEMYFWWVQVIVERDKVQQPHQAPPQ